MKKLSLIVNDSSNIECQILNMNHFSSNTEKVDKPMSLDKYWSLINNSLNSCYTQKSYLTIELLKLELYEIIGFVLTTKKLLLDIYTPEMWAMGDLLTGHGTDDGFEYFRCWVISRGQSAYEKSKETPEYLLNNLGNDNNAYESFFEFEDLLYIPYIVFEIKTGENLNDYMNCDEFNRIASETEYIDLYWKSLK